MNGDYPDLKPSSADSRDGNIYWDIPEYRRNFGEPLHHDFDFQQETRFVNHLCFLDCQNQILAIPVNYLSFSNVVVGSLHMVP